MDPDFGKESFDPFLPTTPTVQQQHTMDRTSREGVICGKEPKVPSQTGILDNLDSGYYSPYLCQNCAGRGVAEATNGPTQETGTSFCFEKVHLVPGHPAHLVVGPASHYPRYGRLERSGLEHSRCPDPGSRSANLSIGDNLFGNLRRRTTLMSNDDEGPPCWPVIIYDINWSGMSPNQFWHPISPGIVPPADPVIYLSPSIPSDPSLATSRGIARANYDSRYGEGDRKIKAYADEVDTIEANLDPAPDQGYSKASITDPEEAVPGGDKGADEKWSPTLLSPSDKSALYARRRRNNQSSPIPPHNDVGKDSIHHRHHNQLNYQNTANARLLNLSRSPVCDHEPTYVVTQCLTPGRSPRKARMWASNLEVIHDEGVLRSLMAKGTHRIKCLGRGAGLSSVGLVGPAGKLGAQRLTDERVVTVVGRKLRSLGDEFDRTIWAAGPDRASTRTGRWVRTARTLAYVVLVKVINEVLLNAGT